MYIVSLWELRKIPVWCLEKKNKVDIEVSISEKELRLMLSSSLGRLNWY